VAGELLFVVVVWGLFALGVAFDAAARDRWAGFWLFMTLLFGPVGLALYAGVVGWSLVSAATESATEGTSGDDGAGDEAVGGVVRSGDRFYCRRCRTRVDPADDDCPSCETPL